MHTECGVQLVFTMNGYQLETVLLSLLPRFLGKGEPGTHCLCMCQSDERHKRVIERFNEKYPSVSAFLMSWVCKAALYILYMHKLSSSLLLSYPCIIISSTDG